MGDYSTPPVVITMAGTDPTGGSGIQADIEAIISMGCHPATVITAVTVQDTSDVMGFGPLNADLVDRQARAILEDMPVAAIKIGMMGSVEVAQAISGILKDYPDLPVVLDPVLRLGSGSQLSDEALAGAMVDLLAPLTTIITPNTHEARALALGADTLDACAMALLDKGFEYVLTTGTHDNTPEVLNTLHGNQRRLATFSLERLDGDYRGSGCTLSASLAALLAQGMEPVAAVEKSLNYTWRSLYHARRLGMGQIIPDRLFWIGEGEDEDDD